LLLNNMAYFDDTLYVGPINRPLQSFVFRNGKFVKSSHAPDIFTSNGVAIGTNPIVSANGNKDGILWALDNSPFKDTKPAILHAYIAKDISRELYNSSQKAGRDQAGIAVKFTAPLVVNGRVYVPGFKEVAVYGLLKN
jgi:hypothetical protein